MEMQFDTPACPRVITPDTPGQLLEEWALRHLPEVDPWLLEHHAVLFRGFCNRDGLDGVASAFFSERLTYTYRSTPRTNLGQYIYTATEYPKQLSIPQHNENAYQLSWPMRLMFHCVTPAVRGGRTPLASTARVTQMIDLDIQEEFARKNVKYVRNYRAGIDLPWEEVFGTNSRDKVEQFCAAQKITVEWNKGGLRTTQLCQSFAHHPVTGERLWFNQAHLFHVSSLDEQARKVMLSYFGEAGFPRNAYFGDGSPIPIDMLEHIRCAYERNKVSFDWQRDDILLIDNMLVSHGREPYDGPRRVLVCMSEPYSPHGINVRAVENETEMVKLHV